MPPPKHTHTHTPSFGLSFLTGSSSVTFAVFTYTQRTMLIGVKVENQLFFNSLVSVKPTLTCSWSFPHKKSWLHFINTAFIWYITLQAFSGQLCLSLGIRQTCCVYSGTAICNDLFFHPDQMASQFFPCLKAIPDLKRLPHTCTLG